MDFSQLIGNMVPITMFNKGKASQYFRKVKAGYPLLVMKNNLPSVFIVSVEEYTELSKLYQMCRNATKDSRFVKQQEEIAVVAKHLEMLENQAEIESESQSDGRNA